ncbi:MAG: MaoC family dehydratase N-terminal domain-containing protein, partial [Pseudomonadaceae bacterium]
MMDIDIDHLRTWVGRERVQRDPLPLFPAQALAGVLNRELLPEGGEALPPAWQWLYFHEPVRQRDLGADGHPRTGDFLPPVPLPRRMWASGEFTIERPLRLGEPAERLARVAAVELKRGGSGALVFVTVEQHIRQAGQECLFERQHLVYRDMPTRPATLPTGDTAVALAQFRVPLTADAVLLMRYSALTYNAHRIHYDRDYATWQEHYPA